MCHLIFLIPLAGIPLFWVISWEPALVINILLWVTFGLLGYKIIQIMRMPTKDGFRSLVGSQVKVVSKIDQGNFNEYLVKSEGELWTARSSGALVPGEKVRVKAINGIRLIVTMGDENQ